MGALPAIEVTRAAAEVSARKEDLLIADKPGAAGDCVEERA